MAEAQGLTEPGSPCSCGSSPTRCGGGAVRRKEAVVTGFQVTLLAAVWWVAAVVVTLWIKAVLSPVNGRPPLFPHSFLFTGLLNLGVAALALLLSQGLRLAGRRGPSGRVQGVACDDDQPPALQLHEVGFLLFLGTLQGIELGLTNKSLSLVSVSVNRMVMACCVVFQLLTAICWGLESIGRLKWAAAALLVAGGVLENLPCREGSEGFAAVICGPREGGSSETEAGDTFLGWACIVASVLTSANRWALTQHIFQRTSPSSALRRLSKVQMLPYLTPGTSLVCLALAGALEAEAFWELPAAAGDLLVPVVVIALAVATLTVCELRIVHLSAATVMVVLSVVHNIPIMLGGVLLNNDHIYRNQLLGFSLCSLGAALYCAARLQDEPKPPPRAQEELLQSDSAGNRFEPL